MPYSGEIIRDERELPSHLKALYPFPRRYQEVSEGVRMQYAEVGEGPPVLFLHGNPTWSFLWRRFLPRVAEQGFRALAPDQVGFGLSDKPLSPHYYSIERHVENLARFCDARQLTDLTLVLHDWGGPIGLSWACRHPERIRRLVLFNTLAFAPRRQRPMSAWHALFSSRAGASLNRRLNLLLESALRYGVANRLDEDVLDGYRFPFRNPATRVAPVQFVRSVPDGPDHPSALTMADLEDRLRVLKEKPALVLWGDADPVFPARAAERWRGALPNLKALKRHPRAGHFLQEDEPDVLCAELVDFLKSS